MPEVHLWLYGTGFGEMRIVAIAAVCKTVTLETPKVRLLLSPRGWVAPNSTRS